MATFFSSRRYRRKVLGLWVLVSVPVAIWWALSRPLEGIPVLAYAASIVALFSLVLLALHLYLSHRQTRIRNENNRQALQAFESRSTQDDDEIFQVVDPESDLDESTFPHSSTTLRDQLKRVDDNVRNYDLGVESVVSPTSKYDLKAQSLGFTDDEGAISPGESGPIVASRDLIVNDVDTPTLLTMSTPEIKQLVSNLQQDKTRLQKLVLAQQAAIDTERRAHDISRVAAQDAIKIMRDARGAQKTAEKLARRERAERQRLERQYHKVKQALTNAKSIINAREEALSRGEIAG